MKSSACGFRWNEIRPYYPDEVGFHHEVISSHNSGIYPVRKDGFRRKKHLQKRTSHKDVRKYPMKSRLRVAKQEKCNMDDRSVLHFFVMCPHLKICAAINKE